MSVEQCQPYIDGAVEATTAAVVDQFSGIIYCLANNMIGSVFVSGNFIQVTFHLMLFPIAFLKLWSSYKDYKRLRINKDTFFQTVLFVFFFVAETVNTIALAILYKIKQVDNCDSPSPVQKLPQVLTFFCSSSLVLLYIIRIYSFVERMITTKPSKFELKAYFYYSMFSVIGYIILFILDIKGVVSDFVTPAIVMYCIECGVLFLCFCVTLFRLIFFISPSYKKHAVIKVLRDSTILLTFLSFGKALCNILATYWAHDRSDKIGTISALSDAISHYNIPMKTIIVILYCRLGDYIPAGTVSDRTSSKNESGTRNYSRKEGRSQMSARERIEEVSRVCEMHEGPIVEEYGKSNLSLTFEPPSLVYDGTEDE